MTARELALCEAVCRNVFRLADAVRVGLDDRGQPMPEVASRDLWRGLPRLLVAACDLVDEAFGGVSASADTQTHRDIAAVIDGRKGKVTA